MYDDAITFGQRQIKKNYRSVTGHWLLGNIWEKCDKEI